MTCGNAQQKQIEEKDKEIQKLKDDIWRINTYDDDTIKTLGSKIAQNDKEIGKLFVSFLEANGSVAEKIKIISEKDKRIEEVLKDEEVWLDKLTIEQDKNYELQSKLNKAVGILEGADGTFASDQIAISKAIDALKGTEC